MPFDGHILLPCRLGEKFEYSDLGRPATGYLQKIAADWQHSGADCTAAHNYNDLLKEASYHTRPGIGPRPFASCWTYEPKIEIHTPDAIWEWAGVKASDLGLDLKRKRDGSQQKVRLAALRISYGRPCFCISVLGTGKALQLQNVPALMPYFRDVWPLHTITTGQTFAYYYDFEEGGQNNAAKHPTVTGRSLRK